METLIRKNKTHFFPQEPTLSVKDNYEDYKRPIKGDFLLNCILESKISRWRYDTVRVLAIMSPQFVSNPQLRLGMELRCGLGSKEI